MIERIIIVGKAASGKDYLRQILQELGLKYAVTYTTRPLREGERHGVDYMFISEEEGERLVAEDKFYEHVRFNDWLYGTTKDQFYEDEVFIMTPKGLSHLATEDRDQSLVLYVDIKEEIREERLLNREMPGDSLERRIEADRKDFENFKDFDVRIYNPDFTEADVIGLLEFMGIYKTNETEE